jgi:hypothetical protein
MKRNWKKYVREREEWTGRDTLISRVHMWGPGLDLTPLNPFHIYALHLTKIS